MECNQSVLVTFNDNLKLVSLLPAADVTFYFSYVLFYENILTQISMNVIIGLLVSRIVSTTMDHTLVLAVMSTH